ncbi:MAG: phenylalanine--tRNA ligase subunit alpha [bacterium]|nr:phenylalanine--tRNA ligase subunit alpha [Candidatus Kapabacteria bacterium]
MLDEIQQLRTTIESEISALDSAEAAEAFRLRHLVRKGTIAGLMDRLREVPKELKRDVGQALNNLRTIAESAEAEAVERFASSKAVAVGPDITLPGRRLSTGHEHPLMRAKARIEEIFRGMGFSVTEGPEVEDDFHNFGALNFAPEHPARDMQDTFFVKLGDRDDVLLRTHTSSVQIRLMESTQPPIRSIMPGRVYRNEAVTARALAEFYQVEGLYVDRGVTMAQLKGTMLQFARAYYSEDVKTRFRPSYFPFTEPSAEMDITCFLCGGKGCRICKYSGWLEIGGCGMVHPNVLRNCNIDPEIFSGYAFGFGIERTLMLKTGIDDIRVLYDNDVRVLEQF